MPYLTFIKNDKPKKKVLKIITKTQKFSILNTDTSLE